MSGIGSTGSGGSGGYFRDANLDLSSRAASGPVDNRFALGFDSSNWHVSMGNAMPSWVWLGGLALAGWWLWTRRKG